MTKLTEEQRAFIQKFVTNKNFIQASRIKGQYTDYQRRLAKVEEEIKALPPDNPVRPQLEARIEAATDKAKDRGNGQVPAFDAAFADLDGVKRDIRAAAKGYRKILAPGTVARRLDEIAAGVMPIETMAIQNAREMKAMLAEVRSIPVPPITSYDDVLAFQASISGHEARWRGGADACRVRADKAGAMATALGVDARLAAAKHDLDQLKVKPDKKTAAAIAALEARMVAVTAAAKPGGTARTAAAMRGSVDAAAKELATAIHILRTVQNRDAGPGTGDRFAEAEKREKVILDRAQAMYLLATASDNMVLTAGPSSPPKPKAPPVLAKFRTGDMVDDATAKLKEDEIDDAVIAAAAAKAKTRAATFIANEGGRTPNSDKLFDMAMRSLNDLRTEVAASLGLEGNPDTWPPKSRKLAEEMAKAVKAAVAENSPNRPSATKTTMRFKDADYPVSDTVLVNGVSYANPVILNKGGLGLITRYQGPPVNGRPSTVVVKSTLVSSGDGFVGEKDEDSEDDDVRQQAEQASKRREMVAEMRVHRALMGGESGTPNPNVVAIKGAAVGADGSLHMIMEEAAAGDAQEYSDSVSVLTRAGLLPKAAQQAMQQDTMLQAVKGLKAMHDLGVLHNDIKALNYLVDADGTVKVGDFGSGETMASGADRTTPMPATTPHYTAPDIGRGKRSEKTDIYTLGAMLHGMDAEIGAEGKAKEAGANWNYGPQARSGHGATSLDRLRNAMMAEKPEDRPTLEGILMSSYLNDARSSFGDADAAGPKPPTADLRKAMAAYSTAVGREVSKLNTDINIRRGLYAQDARKTPPPADLDQRRAAMEREVAGFQAKIDAINARPAVAALLAEVKRVGESFGTAAGNEKDNAWDFAYRKFQAGLETWAGNTPPPMPDDLAADIRNPAAAARRPAAAAI